MTFRRGADRLMEQTAPFPTTCRVCRKPIERGEAIHAFTWSEELGRAHKACGFYSLDADTYTDRAAIACAQKLLALPAGAPMPRALRDEAILVSLVRRVHSPGNHEPRISVTTIGVALLRTLKEHANASKAAPSDEESGATPAPPSLGGVAFDESAKGATR